MSYHEGPESALRLVTLMVKSDSLTYYSCWLLTGAFGHEDLRVRSLRKCAELDSNGHVLNRGV